MTDCTAPLGLLNKPLKNLGCIINGALADKQADEKEINEIAEAVMKEQSSSRIYSMEQVYERSRKYTFNTGKRTVIMEYV